ncbi:MAG: PEP-CTERM sorting domain-containing protein, partial [Kiritimatiellia bacterium]|nr:PEP-CTERM sorting domain-containing protein [Kiritimatiellia bacterium]
PANWNGGVPGPGAHAEFGRGSGSTYKDFVYTVAFTNDVDTAFRAVRNQVTLDLGAFTFLVRGGFNATMIRNDGSLTLNGGTMVHLNNLQVGDFIDGVNSDSGALYLIHGATLLSSNAVGVGMSGAKGTAVVSGSNTVWTHAGANYLSVGHQNNSTGHLTITNEGSLVFTSTNHLYVGHGATGTVRVVGGGVLDITGQGGAVGSFYLQVGNFSTFAGRGTLSVEGSGSEVLTGDRRFFAGFGAGSYGEILVSDGGKWLGNSTSVSGIGWNGTGALRIESGGEMEVGQLYIGGNATGVGTATVSGASSKLTTGVSNALTAENFSVGRTGQGWLIVENTGTVTLADNSFRVGAALGATGDVLVTSGGIIALGHPDTNTIARIGESGTGRMRIEDGGQVTLASLYIGNAATGVGTVTVAGATSLLSTGNAGAGGGDLRVGSSGKGMLIIEDGATVYSGLRRVFTAYDTGSEGTILIRNGGILDMERASTNMATSEIGRIGTGSLIIESGGQAYMRAVRIAANAGSEGNVIVRGTNSLLSTVSTGTGSDLIIGRLGFGTMLVEQGGSVTSLNSFVGTEETAKTGRGSLTVTDAGSLFTASSLGIGGRAWGTVEVKGGTGTVNVLNGGRLEIGTGARLMVYEGSALHVDGGTVVAGRDLHFLEGSTLSLKLNEFDYLSNPLITATHGSGTVRIQNAFLVVGLGDHFDGQVEDFFPILRFTNLDATDNRFFGYDEGATVTADGQDFRISYGQDWSGYVTLTMIPEPGTLGLIGVGLGFAAILRRRRKA